MGIEKINGIPLRRTDTPLLKFERAILGIIAKHVGQLDYGKLSIEISVRNGKVCHVDCSGIKQSYNMNSLEN